MKKCIAILLAATLAATPVTLAACGGSSSEPESTTTEQSNQTKQQFVGNWKLVYAEYSGLTMVGSLYDQSDDGAVAEFTLNEDGTGKMAFGEDADLTWEVTDKDHALLTVEGKGTQTVRYDAQHDALFLDATEDDPNVMAYTKDGKPDSTFGFDVSTAVAFTSVEDVMGDWELYGLDSGGNLFYGNEDALGSMVGNLEDFAFSVKADGSATMGSKDGYTVVESDGAVFLDKDEMHAPLKSLDDLLLIDVADEGEEYYLIYR